MPGKKSRNITCLAGIALESRESCIMRTYCARLEMTVEDAGKLHHTLELHSVAWNETSKTLYRTGPVPQSVIHRKTYRNIRKAFPEIPSQVVVKARMDCLSAYRTARSNKILLEQPMTRKNLAMRLDMWLFKLKKDEQGNLLAMFTVAGNMRNRVRARIVTYPKLDEMMQYELADPLVFERDGLFWIAMSFRNPEPAHISTTCIGVDLGVKRLAVTSEGHILNLPVLARARRRVRYLKRALQELKMRQGRRRNQSARRKLRSVRRRERNISKEMCHRISNQLLETQSNTLVLEDLTGLKRSRTSRRNSNRRAQVPLYEMRQILTYKAQALGKRVETVNPMFTSQDDSRGLPRGERKGCRYYASDGVVLDADHNAAINIARRWVIQNKLPMSLTSPLRGRQDTWAGCSQPAECGRPVCHKPTTSVVGC